ncbi:MAG: ABC transporter permease [Phycisphaerales bacterium]|nr:ABC transporter permease [Phycisphaerales bacterium]
MHKALTVAYREFMETVRTKAFVIGAIIVPMLMVVIIMAMEKFMKLTERDEIPQRTLAVVDLGGHVMPALKASVAGFNERNPKRTFVVEPIAADEASLLSVREELRERVLAEKIYAYIEISADAVRADAPVLLARKDAQIAAYRDIRELIKPAVMAARFADSGLDMSRVMPLLRDVDLDSIDVRAGTSKKENEMARTMTPFVFMFFLWMGTMGISQGLLTSLIEEKSSRIVEVLLSAISPMQLMTGKILGAVAVGLLMMGIWFGFGAIGARNFDFGSSVSLTNVGYLALYFLPAFLLSAALMGAVGSACNTLKEAQSLSTPMTIFNIVPLMLWMPLTQGPQSPLAVALSFVPPITPFVMVLRLCADPNTPVWQIVASLVVLWLGVFAAIWFAAKVFRVGVLMYGKAPTLGEMIRWARQA